MWIAKAIIYFCIVIAIHASAVHAAASTYHVSSSGSTTSNCVSSNPCTYPRAQSLASAGDTINIQGTIGPITISKPGLTIQGGIVDGISSNIANSSAVQISADNTTIQDMEIKNGWAYGFRTSQNINNTIARRINLHHNVRENFVSGGGCNTTNTHGWGSAMRAYFADGLTFTDSKIWENCGEGFSAVMSKNVHGTNLTIWDNWSVGAYPDQTSDYSLRNSSIFCIKPEFNRSPRNRAVLLGAEDSYGSSTVLTRDIVIQNNKIYNCRGLGAYSQTSGTFSNINFTSNHIYNSYGSAIDSITGQNIITTPNTTETITTIPDPTTINPSPSLLPSPSPSPKPGDLNSDGSVNLLDFNLLITNFGNPYTIFDFNAILSNYGK